MFLYPGSTYLMFAHPSTNFLVKPSIMQSCFHRRNFNSVLIWIAAVKYTVGVIMRHLGSFVKYWSAVKAEQLVIDSDIFMFCSICLMSWLVLHYGMLKIGACLFPVSSISHSNAKHKYLLLPNPVNISINGFTNNINMEPRENEILSQCANI